MRRRSIVISCAGDQVAVLARPKRGDAVCALRIANFSIMRRYGANEEILLPKCLEASLAAGSRSANRHLLASRTALRKRARRLFEGRYRNRCNSRASAAAAEMRCAYSIGACIVGAGNDASASEKQRADDRMLYSIARRLSAAARPARRPRASSGGLYRAKRLPHDTEIVAGGILHRRIGLAIASPMPIAYASPASRRPRRGRRAGSGDWPACGGVTAW